MLSVSPHNINESKRQGDSNQMKKIFIILVMAICLSGCASHYGAGWDKTDTTLAITGAALHVIDWGQTRYIAKHPNEHYEYNPIIGNHPSTSQVDLYMLASGLAVPIIAGAIDPKYRKYFLGGYVVLKTGLVIHNSNQGIGVAW